ncbi:MAG: polyribonucleotide nucleotidyltransferase [Elusimicrobiaceae bacterium]|nr:polyribonucleotide nucleotidyltransferase [Elusimicrobiaceae bacterium]
MTNLKTTRIEETVGDKIISLETGLMARQADGAIVARMGDTVLLAAVVSEKTQDPGPADFVPLTTNYKERTYSAGKIPGGFFKREGRPSKKEILSSRLTDRAIRPLFPEGYAAETNVTTMVLSSDGENDADVLSIVAASTALTISCIPFNGPVAGVRVGRIDGQYIINPTHAQRDESDIDFVIAGTKQGMLMVEGGCKEVPENVLIEAMEKAQDAINRLCDMQTRLREQIGAPKFTVPQTVMPETIRQTVEAKVRPEIVRILNLFCDKQTRDKSIAALKQQTIDALSGENPGCEPFVNLAIETVSYEESRRLVLEKGVRVDGRKPDEIRPLDSRVGLLPRTHGSALFTRGQTQGLVVCTLGSPEDMQMVEGLEETYHERFMLHYNFPGFSTGECKPDRSPGRREIGHGELARRALMPLLPQEEEFGYTIRLVSDIMESNGSSSMASVCGGSLSLFDAGVPMKAACAGIAMGLISDGSKHVVLSDIMGLEDHLGDMDFKLTGTRKGITAFQMDVKLASGIALSILKEAVAQATNGRNHILNHMETVITEPRKEMSQYAPRLFRIQIPQEKIGALIGPGGKNIRRITEENNCKVEVNDEGVVYISGVDAVKVERARKEVESLTAVVEVGKIYSGKVVSIQPFGAFVELLPGQDGLLHISEIEHRRVNKVEDVLKLGEEVQVKVVEIDNNGKIRLSRKVLIARS